jgi:hypothetical protein
MRAKIIFSLSVAAGLGLVSLPAFAQEESQGNAEIQELSSHQELNLNEDKALIMDADVKTNTKTPVVRDASPTSQSSNAKKAEQQQKPSGDKTQEDPLSFNFLYYIIQKFKISDIVD